MWQDFDAGGTRNRNRRRKNMSGIPGMGQRWQAVLKIRVTMIPLPENTAAGAASGDSCGVKGCCRVFRQPCRAVLIYSVPHRGRENKNPWQGIMPCLGVWGLLFGRGILTQILEKGRLYTYFYGAGLQRYPASGQGNTR